MSDQRELEIKVKKIMYHKTLHKLLEEFVEEEMRKKPVQKNQLLNSQKVANQINAEEKAEKV